MKEKMRKILSLAIPFIILLVLFISLKGNLIKYSTADEWSKEYEGMGIGQFFDIKPIEGGYIIAGTTFEPYKGQQDTGNGWIVKIDKEGNIIWQNFYGGKDEDGLWCILETEDGYIAGGYTFSYSLKKGAEDFWLVKVDKEGNEIWNKTYGVDGEFGKVIKAKDGGYLLIGSAASFVMDRNVSEDILLIKTDENGNMEWYKVFKEGFAGDDVIETDNGYLISGVSDLYATHGIWDALLIKLDKEGNEIWNKTYGWKGYVWRTKVEEIEDGYMIAGYVLLGQEEIPHGFLIKVDKEGNEIWKRTYGKYFEYIVNFDIAKDGYILCGSTENYAVGNWDAWLLKVDKEGNEIWNKSFGERNTDKFLAVIALNDGYIACGRIEHKWGYGKGLVVKCNDETPPKIKIVKPKENYLYIFDREIMAYYKTLIIGGITVVVEANKPEKINRVEYYYSSNFIFDEKPREIDYFPPYEWKCRVFGLNSWGKITVAARYGNAGAVAVDKIEVYILNFLPSLHKSKIQ